MDKIDQKILIELDKNIRSSNAHIAKLVRVSKDVVNYRISGLRREGILTGFFALVAAAKLGSRYYKLLLKFQSLNINHEKELLGLINSNSHTVWVGACDGNWNLIVTLAVENYSQLSEMIKEICAKYGKFLSKKELLIATSARMFNEKYLYPDGKYVYEHYFSLLDKPETIDEKDKTVLKLITANSRSNISEIAKEINITPEATAKRLKNLLKSGMIVGYKPRINFTKLGYEYFHVFVSTKTPYFSEEILNYYKLHPDCVCIGELMGYYDLWLEFVVKTTQHFRRVLTDLRNRFGQKINEYEPLQIYTEYRINPLPS